MRKTLRTLIAALLLAGCSQSDMTTDVTAADRPVPITFDFTTIDNDTFQTRAANGATGNITSENKELYYTGYGVFAAHAADSKPDIMFNQQVEFTFLADGSGKGYWTYSPLKYWPNDPTDVTFYAYAPYVSTPTALPADATGIIGMSPNDETTPYILYARAKHPEDNVDLLWAAIKPGKPKAVRFTLNHSLARVKLSIGITNGTTLGERRLLVQRVTLTGNFAKTGKLNLTSTTTTPSWFDQALATDADAATDKTIFIDCNPEANEDSYGIVSEQARYVSDLPVRWQPAGLPHTDYDSSDPAKKNNKTNLLCMGDALSYLYLIPQSNLTMTCVLDYCIIDSDGTKTECHKTTDLGGTPIHLSPLNGNTTYELTLTITL